MGKNLVVKTFTTDGTFTAPAGVNKVIVRAFPVRYRSFSGKGGVDALSGQTYQWGINNAATIGDGTTTNRSSPVALVGGLFFKKLHTDANNNSTIALTSDGTAYAFGDNAKGQLGDGTVTSRSSPVAVVGGLKFKQAWIGNHALAITDEGVVYAWGYGVQG